MVNTAEAIEQAIKQDWNVKTITVEMPRVRIPRKLKKKIKGNVSKWFSKRMRIDCFDFPGVAKTKYIFRSHPVERSGIIYSQLGTY